MSSRKNMVWPLLVVLASVGTGLGSLSDGLVAYYPFSGNANDASGNGNNGMVYGATFGNGVYGQALNLDGIDSYVEIPDAPEFDVTSAVTMSAFVYPLSLSGYWGKMIFYRREAYNYRNQLTFDIRTDTGKPCASLEFSNGETGLIYASESLSMNRWYHLAAVYDGISLRMYVDGDLSSVETKTVQGTALNGQTVVSSEYPLAIGRSYDGPDPAHVYYHYYYEDNFHGGIDDARLYNRALSADEIAELEGVKIDIDPDTLNLDSKGKWVTCYIDLPAGHDVSDIDVDSVLLEGLLDVQHSDIRDGVLMVKFDREDLAAYLDVVLGVVPPAEVELVVVGELTDGTPFEAKDTIRVIDEGGGQ